MTRSTTIIVLTTALLLGGCNAQDGTFAPGCTAFAGDTVELTDGRFVWDRFTDQIEIGADGEPVDPYPDYPVSGNVTVDGNKAVMTADDGTAMTPMFLQEIDGQVRLLTEAQHAAWESSGEVEDCALVRQPAG